MKKTLCILLTMLTVTSLLASCASSPSVPSRVTVTSSDAAAHAEWLEKRVGDSLPDTVIGIGSNEKYGVDMSAFRDDGYIVRATQGDTLIFGKSSEGLDRAVRTFAKAVEAGTAGSVDVTYHEGYPVKRLTIGGNDISGYDIVIPAGADDLTKRAASELSKYIGDACGFYPTVTDSATTDSADQRAIVFEPITDADPRYETLGDEGFSFSVDNGGSLHIVCGRYRGAIYGVYDLLERYLGWRFMYDYDLTVVSYQAGVSCPTYSTYNDAMYDSIADAEHIDIPADTDLTVTPSFTYRDSYGDPGIRGVSGSAYTLKVKENGTLTESAGYAVAQKACHGIKAAANYMPQWIGYNPALGDGQLNQPCFTNQYNIEGAIECFEEQINARLAAGQVVGREIVDIDVSQMDTPNFCTCKTCMKQFSVDGSHSGAVLGFANAIAEAIAEDISPDIYVSILAYWGTSAPPKVTRPEPNVAVSYCYYNDIGKTACFSHSMSGEDCMNCPYSFGNLLVSNEKFAEELTDWCDMSTRVIVWIYPGTWTGSPFPRISLFTWLDSLKFMKELDVYGSFICPAYGTVADGSLAYILSRLLWDCDLTEDEYEDMLREYFRLQYGGAGDMLYDLLVIADRAQPDACWSGNAFTDMRLTVNLDFYDKNCDYIFDLFDRAVRQADTSLQEYRVRCFSIPFIYTALVATYDRDYVSGDAASRALYEQRWADFASDAADTTVLFGGGVGIPEDYELSKAHPGSLSDSEHYAKDWYVRGNAQNP